MFNYGAYFHWRSIHDKCGKEVSPQYSSVPVGGCESLAATKTVDGKLAICSGYKGAYKWYFEGDSFESVKAIGFIEAAKANVGLDNGDYQRFYDNVLSPLKNDIKASNVLFNCMAVPSNLQSSIQIVTKGNQRWDGLIASLSSLVSVSNEAQAATDEQLKIARDALKANNFKGKVPYSQAYVDAQKKAFALQDEETKLQDKTMPLLQVLESYLQSELGLKEPLRAATALTAVCLKN